MNERNPGFIVASIEEQTIERISSAGGFDYNKSISVPGRQRLRQFRMRYLYAGTLPALIGE
jgi:hypothetical protein